MEASNILLKRQNNAITTIVFTGFSLTLGSNSDILNPLIFMCVEGYISKMCACFINVRRVNSYFDIWAYKLNLAVSWHPGNGETYLETNKLLVCCCLFLIPLRLTLSYQVNYIDTFLSSYLIVLCTLACHLQDIYKRFTSHFHCCRDKNEIQIITYKPSNL